MADIGSKPISAANLKAVLNNKTVGIGAAADAANTAAEAANAAAADIKARADAGEFNGKDGAAGAAGAKGDKGDKGDTGETGPQGEQGPQGEKGADGAAGKDGIDGSAGKVTLYDLNATLGGNIGFLCIPTGTKSSYEIGSIVNVANNNQSYTDFDDYILWSDETNCTLSLRGESEDEGDRTFNIYYGDSKITEETKFALPQYGCITSYVIVGETTLQWLGVSERVEPLTFQTNETVVYWAFHED